MRKTRVAFGTKRELFSVLNNLRFDRADINRNERRGAAQPNKTRATQTPSGIQQAGRASVSLAGAWSDSRLAVDPSERLGNLSLRKRIIHETAALGRAVRSLVFSDKHDPLDRVKIYLFFHIYAVEHKRPEI